MEVMFSSLALLIGMAIGATVAWWLRSRTAKIELTNLADAAVERDGLAKEAVNLKENLARAQGKLELATTELQELQGARKQIFELGSDNASLRTKLDAEAEAHSKQIADLTSLREEFENKLKVMATDVLKENSTSFAERADGLLKPLQAALEKYELHVTAIETARSKSYGELDKAINFVIDQTQRVQATTSDLTNALKASPKTIGRWAEEQLRRVMEMSQMLEHCDFETEKTFRTIDETLRPDAVISLAGGRTIVVDAKAPVTAYLKAIEASNDEERRLLLERHAAQLRERLTSLSKKSYWQTVAGSADCVVMFVPGDNFVAAAFQQDPDLFHDGINSRVLICTPTTFIALAKAISYGWQQERLAENTQEVSKLGRELYARLATFGGHVNDLGTHINNAVKKYNLMVGSLESSVMPQARRFNDLGVEGTAEPIQAMAEIDTVPRLPQAGRDLAFPHN